MTTTRCAAEDRCCEYDRRAKVPAWAEDGLCRACLEAAARDVRALVYDYVDLEQAIVGTKRGGEPISGTREQTLLISASVESLQRAIWLVTTTWEEVVRDHDGLPGVRPWVRDGFAVQRAVTCLEPRLPLLAGIGPTAVMPFGPDSAPAELTGAGGIIGMMALHAAARSALGLTKLTHEMPGECFECGMTTLRRDNGSETVYCAYCGARQTWDDYRRYVELALAWQKAGRR